MASLDQFAKRIKRKAKKIEVNTDKLVKQVATIADQVVVFSTPVDKGRARSNWIVSLGFPNTSTIEPYAPGEKLGIGENANASAAISQATGIINTRKSGQDIFISNNLPYIGKLNDGYSAQAPSNFVEKAVDAAVNAVNRAKVLK